MSELIGLRASFEKTQALLEHVTKEAASTTSKFHESKIGEGPSVHNEGEIVEFNSAKTAIDKDLSHLLNTSPSTGGDVVYSVHYSDINGLSRLENNILAHEISEFLGAYEVISITTSADNSQKRKTCLPISRSRQSSIVILKHVDGLSRSALCLQDS